MLGGMRRLATFLAALAVASAIVTMRPQDSDCTDAWVTQSQAVTIALEAASQIGFTNATVASYSGSTESDSWSEDVHADDPASRICVWEVFLNGEQVIDTLQHGATPRPTPDSYNMMYVAVDGMSGEVLYMTRTFSDVRSPPPPRPSNGSADASWVPVPTLTEAPIPFKPPPPSWAPGEIPYPTNPPLAVATLPFATPPDW
jgi:hypothetical protein